jgi:4-aminobutyrate aminotransferase-like enzyme
MDYAKNWASIDVNAYPKVVTDTLPGPKSQAMHARAAQIMKGYSGQVQLFPVVFESGKGVVLRDVDGNEYIDFSSGIYVTTLGHCHPKISEAVAQAAKTLMNCHDFTTPIKLELLEKMVEVLPGDLSGVQLYDSGTTAVEAALRLARAATGKQEFISCFRDFHGKSGHSVSLARMKPTDGPARAPGFYMVPRPEPYRPLFTRPDGSVDTERFLALYDEFIREGTTGRIAAFVLEPIQGWGGSVFPPDDFCPKLRKFCDSADILSSPTRC